MRRKTNKTFIYTRIQRHTHYLLENILQLFRQCDRLSFVPGLIELTIGHVRENVVEHIGYKDPTTARNEQRSPVLL